MVHYLTFHNNDFVALRECYKVFRMSKNNFLDNFSFIANWKWNFSSFLYGKQTFLAPKSIILTGTRISENWQSAADNQKWPSLRSELTTFIDRILSKEKWRSTTWFTTFWNLHIFVTFAEFAAWVNERRKVHICLFAIWNMREPFSKKQMNFIKVVEKKKSLMKLFKLIF